MDGAMYTGSSTWYLSPLCAKELIVQGHRPGDSPWQVTDGTDGSAWILTIKCVSALKILTIKRVSGNFRATGRWTLANLPPTCDRRSATCDPEIPERHEQIVISAEL